MKISLLLSKRRLKSISTTGQQLVPLIIWNPCRKVEEPVIPQMRDASATSLHWRLDLPAAFNQSRRHQVLRFAID